MSATESTTLEERVTAARLLGTFPSGSPEWLAARRGGIGGSDIAAVLGMSRWQGSTPYGVWEDKTGRARPLPMSWPLFRGHADEDKLRTWLSMREGIEITQTGTWVHREHDWMRVNPDGIASDGGGVECKSHSWRMGEEWTDDQVSDAAELQAQWGMAVMGLPHWWVIAQIGQDEPLIRRVERDPDLIHDVLIPAAARFWHEHVLTDTAPPVTGLDLEALKIRWPQTDPEPTAGDPDEFGPLLAEREQAIADEKDAAARRADAEARLRKLAGAAQVIELDGVKRLSLVPNGTFSPARFTEDHPGLAAEYVTTRDVVDTDRLRRDHPEIYGAYRARVLRAHTPKEK